MNGPREESVTGLSAVGFQFASQRLRLETWSRPGTFPQEKKLTCPITKIGEPFNLMKIEQLHSLFLSLGGLALPLSPFHKDHWTESLWFDWSRRFNEQDLRLVMRYKKDMIRTRNWHQSTLSFRNTIADCSRFGEWLVEARAHYRSNPQLTNKQKILRDTQREFQHERKPRRISEVDLREGFAQLLKQIDA